MYLGTYSMYIMAQRRSQGRGPGGTPPGKCAWMFLEMPPRPPDPSLRSSKVEAEERQYKRAEVPPGSPEIWSNQKT